MEKKDYRESHLEKGESYHNEFYNNPYRSAIWELEQETLDKFINKYFGNNLIPEYLDFACGTGRVLQHFESKTINATGIDVSEKMLNVARKNCSKAKLIVADITREDTLLNEKFDLITAFRFFPNAQESLRKEVAKKLSVLIKNDGYLVFNNHINSKSLMYRFLRFVRYIKPNKGMSEDEIMDFLKGTGIKITNKFHIGFLPVSEKKPMFSKKYLKAIEKSFMKIPLNLISNLSQDIIYVCQKD